MKQDEIIEMAVQAGFDEHQAKFDTRIEAFAKLVAARDYERGFVDGMQKQMQSSVDKAVNRMVQTERPVDCERCNRLEEQAYDLVGKLRVANIKLSMQPQRKPLTDEELKPLIQKAMMYYGHNPDHWLVTSGAGFCILARAIEAAHGIKE